MDSLQKRCLRYRAERDAARAEAAALRVQVESCHLERERRGAEAWATAGGADAVRAARALRVQVQDVTRLAEVARRACGSDPWSDRIRGPVVERFSAGGVARGVPAEAWVGVAPGEGPAKPWRASLWLQGRDGPTVLASGRVIGGRLEHGEIRTHGTADALAALSRWVGGLYAG